MMTPENKCMHISTRHCFARIIAVYLNGMTQFLHFRHWFCVTPVTLLENPHSVTSDKWQYQSSHHLVSVIAVIMKGSLFDTGHGFRSDCSGCTTIRESLPMTPKNPLQEGNISALTFDLWPCTQIAFQDRLRSKSQAGWVRLNRGLHLAGLNADKPRMSLSPENNQPHPDWQQACVGR